MGGLGNDIVIKVRKWKQQNAPEERKLVTKEGTNTFRHRLVFCGQLVIY